jgi:hypothetical protein
VSSPELSPTPANPHVLWRQVFGFVFWVVLLSVLTRNPWTLVLSLALGGATFADAWKSGIYKRAGQRSILNMSPMSWGITMPLLFVVTYPVYLLNRRKLRTIHGTNVFYWITVGLGALVICSLLLVVIMAIVAHSRAT